MKKISNFWRKNTKNKIILIIIGLFILGIIISSNESVEDTLKTNSTSQSDSAMIDENNQSTETIDGEEVIQTEEKETPNNEGTPIKVVETSTIPKETTATSSNEETTDDNITVGEKNSLIKAKQYLTIMSFSYEGLVEQLEFEGYTNSEAIYGVNNCGANWNEQSAKKAKQYLTTTSFSYEGLIDQLEFEQFTNAQAIYGVNNCGADWNEQAVKKAKQYLDTMAFSREGLISQLEFEQFTSSQAIYGVEQNGL